ncbi:MAG: YwgA family protein [Patescibacteria group bacterium]
MDKVHDYIHSLLSITGEVVGRKKIQKLTYILKILGVPINLQFKYHLYGPYSFDLQLKIDELVEWDMLKEKKAGNGYVYTDYSSSSELEYRGILNNYENILKHLNGLSADDLELISTMLYLKEEGYSDEKLMLEKVRQLKPNLVPHIATSLKEFKSLSD